MKNPHSLHNSNGFDHILLSTGNISRSYIVRDLVFATESMEVNLFDSQNDPNDIFTGVMTQLKEKAAQYGADAIINCQFSYDQIKNKDSIILQILAYGTIVQFKQSMVGS